jgi:hypothetical protein
MGFCYSTTAIKKTTLVSHFVKRIFKDNFREKKKKKKIREKGPIYVTIFA